MEKELTEAQMLEGVETFFAAAFCAEQAKVLSDSKGFKIEGVIEIQRSGEEPFHVAFVKREEVTR